MTSDPPVLPALLRLGLPTMLVLLVQTGVGLIETWFVSFLGTVALTAAAVVFPSYMLMTMMANGGLGGGVASSIARALGAGDRARAESLAFHALVLGAAFGTVFTLALWFGGAALYGAMGAQGSALSTALTYSHVIFAGAIHLWIGALLGAALRGAGQVRVPAGITLAGAIALLVASPLLIFGVGPFPRLDYLLIPLLFGFGTGVVTLVGLNIGAGRPERARRIAWIGAALAGGATGAIGLLAAVFAPQWARLFTADAAVIATTTLYLRTVAPWYGVFGFAMTLYFAGQGARKVGWPVAAGTIRLLIGGVLGAYAATQLHFSLAGLFALVAASSIAFGAVITIALLLTPWSTPAPIPTPLLKGSPA